MIFRSFSNLRSRIGVVSAKKAEPFSFYQPVDYPEHSDSNQEQTNDEKGHLAITVAAYEFTNKKSADHY
jgi:hypothetical protein